MTESIMQKPGSELFTTKPGNIDKCGKTTVNLLSRI